MRVSLLRTHGPRGRGSEGTRKRTGRGCHHPKIILLTKMSQEAGLKIAGGDKTDKHTRHTRNILANHEGAPNLSLNRYMTCGHGYTRRAYCTRFTHTREQEFVFSRSLFCGTKVTLKLAILSLARTFATATTYITNTNPRNNLHTTSPKLTNKMTYVT